MPVTSAERVEIRNFIRKLYRFFEQGHRIEFKKMPATHGAIWPEEYPTKMLLNPKGEMFTTIIHEALHYMNPEWCETQVIREEIRIVDKLTDRQVRNIIKRFAKAL
jgi:hypothetical protein